MELTITDSNLVQGQKIAPNEEKKSLSAKVPISLGNSISISHHFNNSLLNLLKL